MLSLVIGLTLAATTAPEGPAVTVLDANLRAVTGTLVSVSGGTATVKREGKDIAVSGAVAIVAAETWGPKREWPGIVEDSPSLGSTTVQLTDGSRLKGALLAGKGDGLVLVHRTLGKVEFPLDSLERLETSAAERAEPDEGKKSGDTVRLVNGDRFDGFIESITAAKAGGGSGLAVTIEHDKTKTEVPLDRVAWATLRGGTKKPAGATVWLGGPGGERTGVTEFTSDGADARIVRAKGTLAANVPLTELRAALLNGAAVTPLAACAVRAGGTVERGPEQPLGTRDLTLPEPEQAAFEMPKGSRRLTGWAVLPEECRRLGDCTVRIAAGGTTQSREQVLAEFTLNGAAPVKDLTLELPADAAWLSVTVGEGKNGPVQDRVVLRRVLIAK